MTHIMGFFSSPFKDQGISVLELATFASANVAAMVANNPGALFNLRINATNTALSALELGTSDQELKKSMQASKVFVKKEYRRALPGHITKIYAAVVAAFGDPSEQVVAVFRQGRSVFTRCRDEELDDHLQAMISALVPLEPQVGEEVINDASGLRSTWLTVHGAVSSAKAAKDGKAGDLKVLRAALDLELYKNLLAVAAAFPNDEAKGRIYFKEELLRNRASNGVVAKASLSAGVYDPVTRQVTLTASAEGAETLIVRRRVAGESVWTVVAPGLVPAEGVASYVDTVPVPGSYEYQAAGVSGAKEGEASETVTVEAT